MWSSLLHWNVFSSSHVSLQVASITMPWSIHLPKNPTLSSAPPKASFCSRPCKLLRRCLNENRHHTSHYHNTESWSFFRTVDIIRQDKVNLTKRFDHFKMKCYSHRGNPFCHKFARCLEIILPLSYKLTSNLWVEENFIWK